MNLWLKLAVARKIASEIQIKYCGVPYGDDSYGTSFVEDEMTEYLWNHPEYDADMWLNVHWDDFDCVSWVQVGVGLELVPR
jgi:hypothetical protein